MTIVYGSYSAASDTVSVSINRTTTLNQAMESYITTHHWTLTGQVHGDTQNEVVANLLLLEAAFSRSGKDLKLIGNDGTTVCHALLNAGSISGVRITQPPSYPNGEGAELTTFRNFTISAEADYYFAPSKVSQLLSFSESVSMTGGGPMFDMIELINGPALRYRIRNRTAWRATQSGQAVGRSSYPTPPLPIWPGFEVRDPQLQLSSPQWLGKSYTNWGVSWSYEFAASESLAGFPHVWPAG